MYVKQLDSPTGVCIASSLVMKVLAIALLLFVSAVNAEDVAPEVKVADPYLELHTGPGSGYPIFYVVDRNEFVEVLKRKTDWFKVRTRKGKVGWVDIAQMENTVTTSGDVTHFAEVSFGDFSKRRWEVGLVGGSFNNAPIMTLYGGFAFNENLSSELSISKVVGDFSSSQLVNLNLVSQPFSKWRYSPFFTLGIGQIETKPRVTLILAEDRSDLVAHAGIGMKMYLTRRFIFRAEFKNYVAFSSDDYNEEFQEWKASHSFSKQAYLWPRFMPWFPGLVYSGCVGGRGR